MAPGNTLNSAPTYDARFIAYRHGSRTVTRGNADTFRMNAGLFRRSCRHPRRFAGRESSLLGAKGFGIECRL
jgi:hypothetical protein